MTNDSPGPSTSSPCEVIERYFDHEPYEGMAKAKKDFFWLAFERASGLMSERIYTQQIWIAAARNGFPYDHAEILAKHAYLSLLGLLAKDRSSPPDPIGQDLGPGLV